MLEFLVEPHRLYSGVFGCPEGDINAAYSCDVFPKIRLPFIHEGRQYTVGGTASGARNYAFSYELIPAAHYSGPDKQPYSYEGLSVIFRGKQYRLGPKTKFIQRPFTVAERVTIMRKMFAHGGMFASGKTYHQLLREWQETTSDDVMLKAVAEELGRPDFNTQQSMLDFMSNRGTAPASRPEAPQLTFGFV